MPDLPWFVYAMLLAPLGLILVAAVYKTLQVRAAREWPSTPGKVVVSNSEVRDVRVIDSEREDGSRIEQRNFANIVYEYSVSGQKLRNNRVSIGEDRGNFQVAETIAKYPVGTVVTVYYNSLHPHEAVLERDLPKGLWGCLGIGTAIVVAIVFGSAIGLNASDGIRRRASGQSARCRCRWWRWPASAWSRRCSRWRCSRQSALAKTWPVVPGVIKLSGLDQYRAAPDDSGRRGAIMYERKVSYSYRFNGRRLHRRARQLLQQLADERRAGCCGCSGWIFRTAPAVKVWVNPANPSEATLNPRAPFGWLLWLIAAGLSWRI